MELLSILISVWLVMLLAFVLIKGVFKMIQLTWTYAFTIFIILLLAVIITTG
jgi:hypothetical protein